MSRPTVDQLESFVAAAQWLNFRAAAERVGLSPAAFGQRIRALEDVLQTPLFTRTTRRVELTIAGLALLPEAKRVLDAADACIASIDSKEPPRATLTVGTRFELGLSWLVPSLAELETRHPNLELNLYFGASPDLATQLAAHSIDCYVSSIRLSDPNLASEPLHPERYAFVGASALLEQTPLKRPSQARYHCLLDIDPSMPLFRYMSRSSEFEFGRHRWLGLGAAIVEMVRAADGVAVLPIHMVAPFLETGELVRLFPRARLESDDFRLVFRSADPRRPLFRGLAASLRELPLT